jgi:hypothetical protein
VSTAESERHFHIRSVPVQKSPGSEKGSVVRYNKSTIQLREFLYRTPQFIGGDVRSVPRMAFEGIKNQGAGPCHYCIRIADCEKCADPPTFSTFTSYFDGQFEERSEDFLTAVGDLRTDDLER